LAITGRIDLAMFDQWTNSDPENGEFVASTNSETLQRPGAAISPNATQPVSLRLDNRRPETIRVATFNIQFFGPSKVAAPLIMKTIARIVSQFDVVAIQEVRNATVRPINELVTLLQASGANYASSVSQSIGEGERYKEAYAFVFDQNRIRMVPDSAYVVADPDGLMSREPMVASFEVRAVPGDGRRPFRFTLINAHTSPSEVADNAVINEMDVLDDVFTSVRNYEFEMTGEEDFIMLGDLNVDTEGLRELGRIPNVFSVAGDALTNTRRSKTYDHILIDGNMTREYTGRHGVLDLQQTFGISEAQALKISDHQPVWAEFTVHEVPFSSSSSNRDRDPIARANTQTMQR
jgi:endonuclease/exonuclease/phosphatase family metal-dependent hydrolase